MARGRREGARTAGVTAGEEKADDENDENGEGTLTAGICFGASFSSRRHNRVQIKGPFHVASHRRRPNFIPPARHSASQEPPGYFFPRIQCS